MDGTDEAPFASELFVLIEGPFITEFCRGALLEDTKLVCEIPAKTSTLHWNASKGHLIATLEEDLTTSGEITELLTPYAELANQVLTITIKPKVDYKSEEIDRYSEYVAIVHSVGGKGYDKTITELEAPNFIAGVAAGSKCLIYFVKKMEYCILKLFHLQLPVGVLRWSYLSALMSFTQTNCPWM